MRPFQRPAIPWGLGRRSQLLYGEWIGRCLGLVVLALTPLGAGARELPLAEIAAYGSQGMEEIPSPWGGDDLRPGHWAYGALARLIRSEGCGAADADGLLRDQRPINRWEAAALLSACLNQARGRSDGLEALRQHFQKELLQLAGQLADVDARVGQLEAQAFTTTTQLSGQATLLLQANGFGGSSLETIRQSRRDSGAMQFVYDLQLSLDTSFTGKDLLSLETTVNDLDRSGPTSLSQTEELKGGESTQVVSVNRLFYQFPSGPFTVTVGGLVSQDDMLAVWPSVYPAESVLNVLTLNGAPGAYNQNLGAGIGFWRRLDDFSLSVNYVAALGDLGNGVDGGFATNGSGGTGTVQLAYSADQWTIATIYSHVQNGNGVIGQATDFVLDSYGFSGSTSAFGLSGFWEPEDGGWIPSISAGWGYNITRYEDRNDDGQVAISQSWSVGLQWRDAFLPGNVIGMGVGQAPFATRLKGGTTPNDGNLVWEWWAMMQLTDAISVTPAIFYLSRPLGQFTPEGRTFHQLGVLIKTNIDF